MSTPADITKPDKLGRKFDPMKFRPFLDRTGRFLNRFVGRGAKKQKLAAMSTPTETAATPPPPAEATATPPTPETPSTAPVSADKSPSPPPPDLSDIAKAAASAPPPAAGPASVEEAADIIAKGGNLTAETIIGIIQTALVLIGDDEGILTETEKLMLRAPLERVLKKYGVGADALPAEVDLAVALATIVIVRLRKPKTATFAAKVRAWITGKFFSAKGRALAASVEKVNQ